MNPERQVQLGRRSLTLSHPDKLLFPDDGITKGGLLDHYLAVADLLLPHLRGRPLSLQRFPDGISAGGFYQKKVPEHFPDWIATAQVAVKEHRGRQRQTICNDQATLAFLVDQAVITPHPWLARVDRLEHPDVMILDLDPPDDDFAAVRGLAHRVCDLVARRQPDRFTTEVRKDARQGRLFLDYLRNSYGQTAAPPFAVRPLPGAPVAVTLDWEELGNRTLGAQRYRLKNVRRRLGQKEDPGRDFARHRGSAARAARALDTLVSQES